MKECSSKVLKHSTSYRNLNVELVSFDVTFPRIVLSELNTHRKFSRNSASSRAIPFDKMVTAVEETPFIPFAFQKEHKGMQGNDYISSRMQHQRRIDQWLYARDLAILSAKKLHAELTVEDAFKDDLAFFEDNESVTKQLCNRLLESFMWQSVIITTDTVGLNHFFKLRCPNYNYTSRPRYSWNDVCNDVEDDFEVRIFHFIDKMKNNKSMAEIHIQNLAEHMYNSYINSECSVLNENEWHIPYFDDIDNSLLESYVNISDMSKYEEAMFNAKVKVATARCARKSYTTIDTKLKHDYVSDIKLHDFLLTNGHASPFEHIAKVMNDYQYYNMYLSEIVNNEVIVKKGISRNFEGGFYQYRHMLNI